MPKTKTDKSKVIRVSTEAHKLAKIHVAKHPELNLADFVSAVIIKELKPNK